jgi:hypothetical protein
MRNLVVEAAVVSCPASLMPRDDTMATSIAIVSSRCSLLPGQLTTNASTTKILF